MKTAFLFAGQGAQSVGMGRDLAENFASAKQVFDEASEALGFDIRKMIWEGDEETLKITENTQPCIVTVNQACLKVARENGLACEAAAGLSLGEYSAHVAAGTIKFFDAVRLVKKRGKFMQEAVPAGAGGMAAVIGLDGTLVREACEEARDAGYVAPTNYNCPGQITIAGEKTAVEKAGEIAKAKGAKRVIPLAVSAPFHCDLMRSAAEKLKTELDCVELYDMEFPVVSNVTADYVSDKALVKDLLVKQVYSPVLWEDSIRRMLSDGFDTFIELGPGNVLCGFMKKIDKEAKCFNIEDMASLEKLLKEV